VPFCAQAFWGHKTLWDKGAVHAVPPLRHSDVDILVSNQTPVTRGFRKSVVGFALRWCDPSRLPPESLLPRGRRLMRSLKHCRQVQRVSPGFPLPQLPPLAVCVQAHFTGATVTEQGQSKSNKITLRWAQLLPRLILAACLILMSLLYRWKSGKEKSIDLVFKETSHGPVGHTSW
jgi:hypothetical protein